MRSAEEWQAFLRDAGLEDIVARAYHIDVRQEAKARLERYKIREVLGPLLRLPGMFFGDPSFREFLKQSFGGVKHVNKETLEYYGYGVYVGRK